MNKITYTKHCEFCGTEFTTPIHLRRYCSKSCVRAAYKMSLKEKRKSDAVKTLERSGMSIYDGTGTVKVVLANGFVGEASEAQLSPIPSGHLTG